MDRLLHIPAELRIMIYEYAFDSAIFTKDTKYTKPVLRTAEPLLRTCRQVRHEELPYSNKPFHLTSRLPLKIEHLDLFCRYPKAPFIHTIRFQALVCAVDILDIFLGYAEKDRFRTWMCFENLRRIEIARFEADGDFLETQKLKLQDAFRKLFWNGKLVLCVESTKARRESRAYHSAAVEYTPL